MKNKLRVLISFILIMSTFASCKPNKNADDISKASDVNNESVIEKSNQNEQTNSIPSTEQSSQNSNINNSKPVDDNSIVDLTGKQSILNYKNEPPLKNKYPAPDFLSEEQKNTYLHAKQATDFLIMETSLLDSYPLLNGEINKEQGKTISFLDHTYTISTGRYKNWNDFENMIMAMFTKEYFNKVNYLIYKDTPRFKETKGNLIYLGTSRGGNPTYAGVPDTFELVSKDDNKICFNVIGHYLNDVENNDKKKFDYTEKFPIVMVKTPVGWRFSEFNITY